MYYLSKRYKRYDYGGVAQGLGTAGNLTKQMGLSMVPGGQAISQITNGAADIVDSLTAPKDEFSRPSMFGNVLSGTLRGGTIGGIAGFFNYKQQLRDRANRITDFRAAAPEKARSEAMLANNPELQTGYAGAEFFANGGSLKDSFYKVNGGYMKPMSNESVEVEGPSHEQGGVQIPQANAEVEGGETIHNDFVFSDRLGFADAHRKIAKAIGKIEKKGVMTPERTNALDRLNERQEQLKLSQEFFKQTMLS